MDLPRRPSVVKSIISEAIAQVILVGNIFNPLEGMFPDQPDNNLIVTKGLEKFARYRLVKVTPTNQNRAHLI